MSEVELSQTLREAFNVDTEEGSSFDLVPVGNYVAIITDAMVGSLKSGNGQSIRMTWQIQGGEYDGRKVLPPRAGHLVYLHTRGSPLTRKG